MCPQHGVTYGEGDGNAARLTVTASADTLKDLWYELCKKVPGLKETAERAARQTALLPVLGELGTMKAVASVRRQPPNHIGHAADRIARDLNDLYARVKGLYES